MGCEVKTDMGDQAKHSVWGFSVQTGKYVPLGGLQRDNFSHFLGLTSYHTI